MEGISDIKIIGIDQTRPPRSRKEPYINLYFKLSHKAPEDWCDAFNQLVSKHKFASKIEPKEGLFIDTWVRKPEEIVPLVDGLKAAVIKITEAYIALREAEALAAKLNHGEKPEDEGEQARLNRIVESLNFDD
ncbi:MAG: hypothetical protein OQK78_12235 [Gammaproteobacteria bacterium]|nr:hypothetical protein [Gammaproteobacteria bacterium]